MTPQHNALLCPDVPPLACLMIVQNMVDKHPMLFLDPLHNGDDEEIPHDELLRSLDEDIGMPFDDPGAFGDLDGGLEDHHLDGIQF